MGVIYWFICVVLNVDLMMVGVMGGVEIVVGNVIVVVLDIVSCVDCGFIGVFIVWFFIYSLVEVV